MEAHECYDCGRMEGKFGIIQTPAEKPVYLCDICYGEWLRVKKGRNEDEQKMDS